MNVELEHLFQLDGAQAQAVRDFSEQSFGSLDAVELALKQQFPGWFVYRGGSHVALHRAKGWENPRIAIWSES